VWKPTEAVRRRAAGKVRVMGRRASAALFVLLALAVGPSDVVPVASAQGESGGAVRGTARDVQGAVLPGVTVTAVSPSSPRTFSARTNSAGAFRLTDLPPDTSTVTAELRGFSKTVLPGIAVGHVERPGGVAFRDLAARQGARSEGQRADDASRFAGGAVAVA
jgi:hypothetical protein